MIPAVRQPWSGVDAVSRPAGGDPATVVAAGAAVAGEGLAAEAAWRFACSSSASRFRALSRSVARSWASAKVTSSWSVALRATWS